MRIFHCRGFGVQSPFAYRLTRYVINEHYPYYAYGELARQYADADRRQKKLCRLYLRLANYLQPSCWLYFGGNAAMNESYVHAGSNAARFMPLTGGGAVASLDAMDEGEGKSRVVNIDMAMEGCDAVAEEALRHATPTTVVIMENIRRNRTALRRWKSACAAPLAVMSFDLYYCGLIFFNPIAERQHFKINF